MLGQLLAAAFGVLLALSQTQGDTFHNPLFNYDSADPYMIRHGDYYYLTFTEWDRLSLRRSRSMTDWSNEEKTTLLYLPPGWIDMWAPEIHFIRGNFYIYFTMADRIHPNHRMYVMKAEDPNDPLGRWTEPVKLFVPDADFFAIDGTTMEWTDGSLYHIWSGWARLDADPGPSSNYRQTLYMAPMSDPMTISGSRVHLREPGTTWEFHPYWGAINEGPSILKYANRTFIVFSAASTWTPDYCLGALVIDDWKDPMVPENWVLVEDNCMFYRNDEQSVWAPGHASFTTSPDGKESWIIYHAISDINNPGTLRSTRAEKFYWNYDNTPAFPRPSGFGVALDTPSGQYQY